MKKNLILKIGLIIFVVLILYLYESFQWKSPQIKTTIELKNVTEEEYSKKIDLHKCDYNGLKNLYVEILAMHNSNEIASSAIRFSFGEENTLNEINYVIQILASEINKIRENL